MSNDAEYIMVIPSGGMLWLASINHPVQGQLFVAYTRINWANSRSSQTFMVRSDKRRLSLDRLFDQLLYAPIPVIIECEDDTQFIATISDLNMAMSGESVGDALAALKEYVEMSIESFCEERDNLGPEPARQLAALEGYIGQRKQYQSGNG